MPELIALQNGKLELHLQTEGGRIERLFWRGASGNCDILRPSPAGSGVFEAACFALVPYSNRLFGGLVQTPAGPVDLPPNVPWLDLPVHGLGWRKTWSLREETAHGAVLHYSHTADADWPFAHECTQTLRLEPQGLHLSLSLRNLGRQPMPAGLGFHPRFLLDPDSQVRFDAPRVWLQDAQGWPKDEVEKATLPVDSGFDFSVPRFATAVEQNHCHAGWHTQAHLSRPASGLRVTLKGSAALGHLMVYRKADQDWLCLEPVSHATGALSLPAMQTPAHGARLLAPGRTWTVSLNLSVRLA